MQGADLAPARAAARRWGVAPESVRLVDAIRLGPHDLNLIVAGTDASDHTCLGFVVTDEPVEFFCSGRLSHVSAVLLVLRPSYAGGGLFVEGISSAAVTKVVIEDGPGAPVFDRKAGVVSYWGTFGVSLMDADSVTITVSRETGTHGPQDRRHDERRRPDHPDSRLARASCTQAAAAASATSSADLRTTVTSGPSSRKRG